MREKGKWGKVGGRAYTGGVLQAGHSFLRNSSWFSVMWNSHSSMFIPQSFIFPTLRAAAGISVGPAESQLGTGAAVAPGIIIMVEALPTAWLLTPWKAETISANKR